MLMFRKLCSPQRILVALSALLLISQSNLAAAEDSRLIAYLGNWQSCPTTAQTDHYTHIVVAFAVSYSYNAQKNVCDTSCTIGSPVPVCNNQVNQPLVDSWHAQGKKVILSFGGAGMGGSWAGDVNDCWDYCYGKEASVISQLDTIVRAQNFDGIDIDYEYFYNTMAAQTFLETITTGLRDVLPSGSIVTHAPMDPDVLEGTAYYNILKRTASSLDFIMPQYYNGFTRPAIDGFAGKGVGSVATKSHYDTLVNDMFEGDATKVVFGFCISDCSGTNSNANTAQAVSVLNEVQSYYACHGGAFFWVVNDDVNGGWSGPVSEAVGSCGPPTPISPTTSSPIAPVQPTPPTPPSSCPNKDNSCGPNNACADSSMCCSQWGYCGTTASYCGTCCQNGPCDGVSPPVTQPVVAPVVAPVAQPVVMPVTQPVAQPVAPPVQPPIVDDMYCGTSWNDAASTCGTPCPQGNSTACGSTPGMRCWAGIDCTNGPPEPPEKEYFCGSTWNDADQTCGIPCPNGNSTVCESGQRCFADTSCTGGGTPVTVPVTVPVTAPVAAPVTVPVAAPVTAPVSAPTSSNCPPAFSTTATYVEGDKVSAKNKIYKCKAWPYTGWCSTGGYEPGASLYWEDAWTVEGTCSEQPVTQPVAPPVVAPVTAPVAAPVTVPVTAPVTAPVAAPTPSNCPPAFSTTATYVASDEVTVANKIYKCKEYPYTGWCSTGGYEPGTSQYWEDAWTLEGTCSEQPVTQPVASPIVAPVTGPVAAPITVPVTAPVAAPVTVPVTAPVTAPVAAPTPSNCPSAFSTTATYVAGDEVTVANKIYKCKVYPYTGWCSTGGYEPGTSLHWQDAWTVEGTCSGQPVTQPVAPPIAAPITVPVTVPVVAPVTVPVTAPVAAPVTVPVTAPVTAPVVAPITAPVTAPVSAPSSGLSNLVEAVLDASKEAIDNKLFLYETPTSQWLPSTVYRYSGFLTGLRVMVQSGVANKFFYIGPNDGRANAVDYGLVNIAAFFAQSMKETIRYDACDENSWDLFDGKYPISNACGQLSQSYQDYECSEEEKFMQCDVNPQMEMKAVTNAKWYGAPQPLYCGPKTKYPETGYWNFNAECNRPWANPPELCTAYPGQKAGKEVSSPAVANRNGRTDVEGCCWWGRGVIQTTGICNFGKLNYFLGKRAADEGRDSRYPSIDFCTNPEAVCASEEFAELKWIAGMFYWIESLQAYESAEDGWNYINKLHEFVDGGMNDMSFIDAVSGIVNRGCHNPPCGTGDLDGGPERKSNFIKVLDEFGLK